MDFNKKTINALAKRGIVVMGSQAVPIDEQDTYFAGVAYALNNNGRHEIKTHQEVLALSVAPIGAVHDRCLVYRTGTPEAFTWHRSEPMTEAEARAQTGRYDCAYVEKYALSYHIGLPETYGPR